MTITTKTYSKSHRETKNRADQLNAEKVCLVITVGKWVGYVYANTKAELEKYEKTFMDTVDFEGVKFFKTEYK